MYYKLVYNTVQFIKKMITVPNHINLISLKLIINNNKISLK